jgi:hypothetical protein
MTDAELLVELGTRLEQRHANRDRESLDVLETYLVSQAEKYSNEGREDAWVATDLALSLLRELRGTDCEDTEQ